MCNCIQFSEHALQTQEHAVKRRHHRGYQSVYWLLVSSLLIFPYFSFRVPNALDRAQDDSVLIIES